MPQSTPPSYTQTPTVGGSGGGSPSNDAEEEGEWITFLHGFPTCSHDFACLLPLLRDPTFLRRYNLLLWDLWGYGDSDKQEPLPPFFSVHAQADIQQALWRHFGIAQTHVVSHDLGDTVLQVGWLFFEMKRRVVHHRSVVRLNRLVNRSTEPIQKTTPTLPPKMNRSSSRAPPRPASRSTPQRTSPHPPPPRSATSSSSTAAFSRASTAPCSCSASSSTRGWGPG